MFDNLKEQKFIVFDIETTGLDYRIGNQVIELAGQKLINGEVVDEFHELINPTVPIEDGAYRVHGLSNLFLAEEGKEALEVFEKFHIFAQESILVGHNIINFDLPFLNSDLSRCSLQPLSNFAVDTLLMARTLLPQLPNHKLGTVALHFNVDPAGAHRAMVDVEMNKKVFLNMLDQYIQKMKPTHSTKPSSETLF